MTEGAGELEINRSSDFQNQLDKARVLPQETEQQKAEKLRSARLLRMKALLANAELNHRLTGLLSVGKDVNDELFIREGIIENIIHPDQTVEVARVLSETREQATKYFNIFAEDAKGDLHKAGEAFFLSMTGKKPKGQILLSASYRFAMTVFIYNQDDFNKIDEMRNNGGFFNEKRPGYIVDGKREYFPLIVIQGDSYPPLFHEEAHSQIHAIRQALAEPRSEKPESEKTKKRQLVWGKIENLLIYNDAGNLISGNSVDENLKRGSIVDDFNRLVTDTDIVKAKASTEFKHILSWAYSGVKNEYLAQLAGRYSRQDSSGIDRRSIGVADYPLLHFIRERGGLYDYFFNNLKLKKNSPLYQAFWEEYDKMLQKVEAEFVKKPGEVYSRLGLNYRHFLYRGVLLQFPLEDWERQMQDSLFMEEVTRLGGIYNQYQNLSPIEFLLRRRVKKDIEEMKQKISQNPTVQIFDLIEKTERHLGIKFEPKEEQRIEHKKRE